MNCPRCGAGLAAGRRFCGDCGTALPWLCVSCGDENPADKRFCGSCGVARTGAPRTPEALAVTPVPERRLLSVMFVDMVGSTALGLRLDPEDLREAVNAFHACIATQVTCLNGFIARHMGDGVLVYFGYPQAHETDAERAIRAGLAIVGSVPMLDTTAGGPGALEARVGIDSGLVVAGDLIGSGASLEAA